MASLPFPDGDRRWILVVAVEAFADRGGRDTVPAEGSDRTLTEQQIRSEIGEILDRLQSLPAEAFAERSRLRDRQAELGRTLRMIEIPGSEGITQRWAKQAGSKATEDLGHPEIVSPIESGGGGGQ